jgi:hypothetical protein
VCDKIHQSLSNQSAEELSAVFKEGDDDTIYKIDRDVEDILLPLSEEKAESLGGVILIAEGIGEGEEVFVLPRNSDPNKAALRIIIDPIDGTRGIMYDKRAAFFLSGVAPNKGVETSLQDIEVSVMTELPTSRSFLSDTLWAIKGKGAHGFTRNLITREVKPKKISPSKSKTLLGGFGQIARFFPPGRDILAKIEDEMIETVFPNAPVGKAIVFEDQYISSGGQLYEMLVGHDRFVGEIRTGLYAMLAKQGKAPGHTCHPYDLCAHLIGIEAGIIITDRIGNPLNAPLDAMSSVDWIGYANEDIKREIESTLQSLMNKYGILNP